MENRQQTSLRYTPLSAQPEAAVVDQLMARALESPEILSIAAGFTDNACLPGELISDAVQAIQQSGRDDVFQYGSNQGRPALREAALKQLDAHNGEALIVDQIDQVLISNGSQQTLYLAMQTLCVPGDIVLVQAPTYFVFVELARGLGIELRVLPTTETGGLDLEALSPALTALERSGERARVKAVYFVSYFANPSSYSLSLTEKEGLAKALRAQDWLLPIVEDAAYRELWFEAPPEAPSILSISAFSGFPCLYLGTFTKPFATGLKVGYGIFSDMGWCERCGRLKSHQDFGTANFNQAIVEHILPTPSWDAFQCKMRTHYLAKKTTFLAALEGTGLREKGFRWEDPQGGLLLWARGPVGLDTGMNGSLFSRAIEERVLYVPGSVCMPDPTEAVATMRLSYGALDADLFPEALRRLERAITVELTS